MIPGLSFIEEAAVAAIAVVMAAVGGMAYGAHIENTKWKAQVLKDQLVYEQHLARAREDSIVLVDHYVQGDIQIQTVFKDRVIYRTKEVPHEIIVRSDAACGAIPVWFVSMWNSANQASIPGAAEGFDGGSSNVVLSDVSAQHDREAGACLREEGQLKALKDWVRANYKDINGKALGY